MLFRFKKKQFKKKKQKSFFQKKYIYVLISYGKVSSKKSCLYF